MSKENGSKSGNKGSRQDSSNESFNKSINRQKPTRQQVRPNDPDPPRPNKNKGDK